MPQQFCLAQGCGVLVRSGRCAQHAPRVRDGQADRIAHRWYVSARWVHLRQDIIRRDPFCQSCKVEGRRTLTVDVDHLLPHRGDPMLFWDVRNLQGLCRSCHSRKTKGEQHV